jgi:RNA polymerase nonessential primary-like sigma factor
VYNTDTVKITIMSSKDCDTVRFYLQQIGKYELLTSDQEITLARQVQKKVVIDNEKKQLSEQLKREATIAELSNFLNQNELEITRILRDGKRAKQKMVTANMRLVVSVAKKYQRRNLEFLDLIQEGAIGLQIAIERFNPERGYKLSTYAYWWIRQAITRAIAEKSRTIRLPIHVTEKLNKIRKVQRELTQILGRSPTVTEIGQKLGLEPNSVRDCILSARKASSLNVLVGKDKEQELGDLIGDDAISAVDHLHQELFCEDLDHVLASLKPQQREVLILRFGLLDNQEWTLAQIGQKLNVSRERVRQIQQQAMNSLRNHQPKIAEYLSV